MMALHLFFGDINEILEMATHIPKYITIKRWFNRTVLAEV